MSNDIQAYFSGISASSNNSRGTKHLLNGLDIIIEFALLEGGDSSRVIDRLSKESFPLHRNEILEFQLHDEKFSYLVWRNKPTWRVTC